MKHKMPTMHAGRIGGLMAVVLLALCSPALLAQQSKNSSLSASPVDLKFGNVVVGSSLSLTDLLTNTGKGGVTVTGVSVTGSGFSVSGITLPASLGHGQSASWSGRFAPMATGSSFGSVSFTSSASNSPTMVPLSGTGTYAHSVGLNWVDSSTSDVKSQNIYRDSSFLVSVSSAAVSFTDLSVAAGETHTYWVTAVDQDGESGPSNSATVLIPSP